MKELKTLKDLKDYEFLKLEEGFMEGHKFKDVDELKAEAVKRIKALEDGEIESLNRYDWEHFFNITEEDLK